MMKHSQEKRAQRILIVDDNPAIHQDYLKILKFNSEPTQLDELSSMMFGEEGSAAVTLPQFEIDSAYQGQEALEMVTQAQQDGNAYAMAFVDMRMPPGWDGLQTIEKIWEVDPHVQVVICTAYSDYSWSEIVDRIAYRDRLLILKKPFDNIEVCQLAIALTQKWELERLAENRMDSIVETAADAILTTRTDGTIDIVNQATCELFGYSEKELHGKAVLDLFSADTEADHTALASLFEGNLTTWNSPIEVPGLRKDGLTLPALLSVSNFAATDGTRFTAIVRDLSEYKQMQEKLVQAQKLESVGQLAAGVAHEINTPMQFLDCNVTFLQTCEERLGDLLDLFEQNLTTCQPGRPWEERWQEISESMEVNNYRKIRKEMPAALAESVEGIHRVAEIVRAMKDLTHPGKNEKTKYDLNRALENAVTLSRHRWKDIAAVDLSLDPALPEVMCLGTAMNQVFINLIVNAADAIGEKLDRLPEESGAIRIATCTEEKFAKIVIADNGAGISEDILHRIFDPFFTTKDVGKGTGQGLAISHDAIVNKHNGTIDVESTLEEGTTFTIRIPRTDIVVQGSDENDSREVETPALSN